MQKGHQQKSHNNVKDGREGVGPDKLVFLNICLGLKLRVGAVGQRPYNQSEPGRHDCLPLGCLILWGGEEHVFTFRTWKKAEDA